MCSKIILIHIHLRIVYKSHYNMGILLKITHRTGRSIKNKNGSP